MGSVAVARAGAGGRRTSRLFLAATARFLGTADASSRSSRDAARLARLILVGRRVSAVEMLSAEDVAYILAVASADTR
jgi:hypothetical protein